MILPGSVATDKIGHRWSRDDDHNRHGLIPFQRRDRQRLRRRLLAWSGLDGDLAAGYHSGSVRHTPMAMAPITATDIMTTAIAARINLTNPIPTRMSP